MLKLVDIVGDSALIEETHKDAKALLSDDPHLQSPENLALAREIRLLFNEDETPDAG